MKTERQRETERDRKRDRETDRLTERERERERLPFINSWTKVASLSGENVLSFTYFSRNT